MPINLEVLWNLYLTSVVTGMVILTGVLGGFTLLGFVCSCCQEIVTRKDAQARRKKEAEAATIFPGMAANSLSRIAEIPCGAAPSGLDYRL